jgi:FlgD Ig-like domain
MRLKQLLPALFIATGLAPSVSHAQWAVNGNPVCTATGSQEQVDIASDTTGDAVVVWQDYRGGATTDIYARRITSTGSMSWTGNGVPLCTATGYQLYPHMTFDGFGHFYYVWEDSRGADRDIYMAATDNLGNVLTPANGTPICTATGDQSGISFANNSALGTVYAAWTDARAGNNDIYVQAFNYANYNFLGTNGKPMCALTSDQTGAAVCNNWPNHDGAIVAWQDYRSGTSYDIYAQSVDLGGNLLWAVNGIGVCTQGAGQTNPMIIPDGSGGAFIAWQDNRNGTLVGSIYAQHVNASGTKLWATDGVPVAISTDLILLPKMIPDGAGGAILAWEDDRNISTTGADIYAQRINGSGTVLWGTNGVVVCNASYDQSSPDVTSDGANGCVVTWQDVRGLGAADVYAQRISAGGVAQWTGNGVVVSNAANNQFNPGIAYANDGACIVAWEDWRNATHDIYAQRLDMGAGHYGYLAPYITSIIDVPADQGGFVRVTWRPGDADAEVGPEYQIIDNNYQGDVVATIEWNGSASYQADVLTTTVGSPDLYYVTGNGISPGVPGTSYDNLAPPAPTLTGSRSGTTVNLSWNSTAPDIGHYVLERTDVGTLASPTATNYADMGAPLGALTYRVHAVDIHGNVGPESNDLVIASGVGVGDGVSTPRSLTILPNTPNPYADRTTLRFGMAREGSVKLTVFNVAGRRVAGVEIGSFAAGWHELAFNGRDDNGRPLPSGMYFYRLDAGGETRNSRMVIGH